MEEYNLYHSNSIFKVSNVNLESERPIGKFFVDSNDGYVECRIVLPHGMMIDNTDHYIRIGNFGVYDVIKGRLWLETITSYIEGKPYFYKKCKWEFMFKVKDEHNSSDSLTLKGYNTSYTFFSIPETVSKFLNQLYGFETIEDYKIYYNIVIEDKKGDFEDEIMNLAKVISLCKKYEEINPAFSQRELRKWIEGRIKSLVGEK